ncbi:MAG: capsular polysaccharide biosynthesis protein, partial [Polaromonas sp.]|nr:capsular polysaccharide biosynthesis protein [Polaromonas sp.]
MILLTSAGMSRIPFLSSFLGQPVQFGSATTIPSAVAGWGRKKSGDNAQLEAARNGVPCWWLEDGFIRSFGTGDRYPPLSLVVDEQGIYYDSTQPSSLESVLNSPADVLGGIADNVNRAIALVLAHGLSKYNHAPEWVGYPELEP